MNLRPYLGQLPRLGPRCYVDPSALVIGDVELGEDSSVWPLTVIRGDVNFIRIGARTNIQDGCVLHVTHNGEYTPGGSPLVIGDEVTVGHGVILHACTVGQRCLVGMGARVLDNAVLEDESFIGAGAVVPPGKVVGSGELWLGNPARRVRALSARERAQLRYSAEHYVRLKDRYLNPPA